MNWKTQPWLGAVAGLSLGLAMGLGISERAEAGCSTENYVGSICFMASSYCPPDFMEASGQLLPISNFQALYAVMGPAYGGDGRTTVQLPDLRSRTAVGIGPATSITSQVVRGTKRGTEQRTLEQANMVSHTHTVQPTPLDIVGTLKANKTAATLSSPTSTYPAPSNISQALNFTKGAVDTSLALDLLVGTISTPDGATTSEAGSSQPFKVVGPRLGLLACIQTKGLFPPRP